METERLRECLATNYLRLRDLAEGDLAGQVPSCPEWTLADLVSHVANVYLHKVETMRRNGWPDPWPPQPTGESEAELLERAYQELDAEFSARSVTEQTLTWYGPDQTVGFWLRRMAHETLVHSWDAELAASVPSLPVPGDLALDGIDEALSIFVTWACEQWPEDFAEELAKGDGAVAVSAGPNRLLVSWDGSSVSAAISDSAADAEVAGSPDAVLRWLWGRVDESAVMITGDPAKVAQLRGILRAGTQ